MSWFNDDKDLGKYQGWFAPKPDREWTGWDGRTVREYDSPFRPTQKVEFDCWGKPLRSGNRWF